MKRQDGWNKRAVQLQVVQETLKYAMPPVEALHDGPVHFEFNGHTQSPKTKDKFWGEN